MATATQVPWTDPGGTPCCCDDPTVPRCSVLTTPPFTPDITFNLTNAQITLAAANLLTASITATIGSWQVVDTRPYVTLDPTIGSFVQLGGETTSIRSSSVTLQGIATRRSGCNWRGEVSQTVAAEVQVTNRWMSGCIGNSTEFPICGSGQIVSSSTHSVFNFAELRVYIRRFADQSGGVLGLAYNLNSRGDIVGTQIGTAPTPYPAGAAIASGSVLGNSFSHSKPLYGFAFGYPVAGASGSAFVGISITGAAP